MATIPPVSRRAGHAGCSEIDRTGRSPAIFKAKRPDPRSLRGGLVRPHQTLAFPFSLLYSFHMGTPIHRRDPDNVGETCEVCESGLWGEGFTPYTVQVVFHGVIPEIGSPDPPNNFPITCEQVEGSPCMYQGWITYGGYNFQIKWWSTSGLISMEWINGFWRGMFWGYAAPCSVGPYPNDFTPGSGWAYGGSAYVLDLPLYYVSTIADVYNIAPDPRGLYDDQPSADPDQRVLRLANRTFGGSVQILFEPGAIE